MRSVSTNELEYRTLPSWSRTLWIVCVCGLCVCLCVDCVCVCVWIVCVSVCVFVCGLCACVCVCVCVCACVCVCDMCGLSVCLALHDALPVDHAFAIKDMVSLGRRDGRVGPDAQEHAAQVRRALYAAAPIFWSSSLSSQSTACTRSTSSRPSRPDRQRLALGRSPFSPSLFSLLTSGGGAADALAPGPRERADAGAWRSFTGTGYVHARRGRGGAPAKAWHASAHISTSTRHGATEGGRTLTVPTHEPNYSGQTSPDRLLKRRKASFSISDTN
jgi:hypothetical protein